ncbi:MAG TPA: hypothetical protein DDW94_04990 [Deltaproteobacteria bacterium]|nr:MAG: hypothetical protein A2Z79_00085 [Deltaproteobacteria bacterium GWA2_55_82]OGQ64965.1 MAG: hypothetical protein A3I81_01785 [Deltaproteobacteria bacterium RIFCSPLOWO2_02_FULL_55_12]OIJ73855.1 MAG: hypothetical protein A2V21_305990 [Deltaproteobacteria bacterium GWC2_55_46]HBG46329.1 hypothetical protein [Deltaproteobacteria bacterium]HCY09841.1 hypothetical protein [Deltaproteobacteria bacterium]
MRNSKFFQLALAFGLAMAVAAPSAYAAGEKAAKTSDISKFKEQIQKDTNLSQSDINAIEPQLSEFAQRNADPDKVSALAKTAVDSNCTGSCLRDVLLSMNNAMSKGLSDNDAQDMVSQALRDQVQARGGQISDPAELGSQVRASVEAQLASRPGAQAPGTTGGMSGTESESTRGMSPGGTTGGGY